MKERLFFLICFLCISFMLKAADKPVIKISTENVDLIYRVTMQDDKYPVTVKLHYVAYQKENLIKTFTEISHQEKKPVQLHKYASSMLHLNRDNYFLTEFSGDWASEAHVKEQPLEFGKKTIDTKLGARANMFCSPFFQLSLDGKSEENQGEVLVGTLGWTGNFSFVFEVDNKNELRVISGINPYASEYSLKPNEIFRTMFLLDDGWFANKYPRSGDHQGLGDWDETADKLPHGVGYLTEAAKKKGIKFGIWIEPEMVNPKSELYEKHKDWVIHLPNRDEYYFRNQLVLDLSNPKVQDYVFGVVDNLMTKYPDIAFFKWDCNSPITNIYSVYLKNKQSHLYIDYVRGLYNVLERVKAKYPNLPMMLCSGGGGRSDYEALKYFTEFWPSDNTDPIERLFIQWGFSQVFPAKTMCAHVTTWNKNSSVKFRTDVAMMCRCVCRGLMQTKCIV